jgi:hypothetical protein
LMMKRSTGRQSSLAVHACAAALAWATPVHADTVRVQKTVTPVVAETITMNDVAVISARTVSGPFNCPFPPQSPDAEPTQGQILIGFEPGSAAFSDGCFQHFARAHRGVVLFTTHDLPHHFKSATLVLNPDTIHNSTLFPRPFSAIFETSVATSQARFLATRRQVDLDSGRATVNSHTSRPDGFDDSSLQRAVTGSVQNEGTFGFRIDVTANVHNWLLDWPKRDQTPLRGFVFVSADESLPDDGNVGFSVSYVVTLEFEIDEPDM